jgi:hypothetical protein
MVVRVVAEQVMVEVTVKTRHLWRMEVEAVGVRQQCTAWQGQGCQVDCDGSSRRKEVG